MARGYVRNIQDAAGPESHDRRPFSKAIDVVTVPEAATRVAVVQMACELNAFAANTARASRHLAAAAAQGAVLALLPELMPNGYTLTHALWAGAEPFDGPTLAWLRRECTMHRMMIGTTFLEADGEDFFNTFVLVGADGSVLGKVRKNPPASFEAWFFRAGDTRHWFETPIGRVGVGICFENALYDHYLTLHEADVDLMLRPFSGASFEARFPIRAADVAAINEALRTGTAEAARLTGRPVLMANKVGRLVTALSMGGRVQTVEFPGYSAIADGDGRLLGQLGPGEEGAVIGDVRIDPARKAKAPAPRRYGKWTAPLPWWAVAWDITGCLGQRAYSRSASRRAAALAAQA